MMKKYVFFTIILLLLGRFPAQAADEKITLLYVDDWSSEEASSHLIECVMERHLGYEVSLIGTDIEGNWKSIASGEADFSVSVWLPLQQDYVEEYGSQVDILEVPFLEGAQNGLVVPSYVPIDSIEELNSNAQGFENKIIGIDPGAGIMQTTKEAISRYGLSSFSLVAGSETTMIEALDKAIDQKKHIVITGWRPHWKFQEYNLKFLTDSKKVYGEGGDGKINIITHQNLKTNDLALYEILERLTLPPHALEELMNLNRLGGNPHVNACSWADRNPEIINEWIYGIPIVQPTTFHFQEEYLEVIGGFLVDDVEQVNQPFKAKFRYNTDERTLRLETYQLLNSTPLSEGAILNRVKQNGRLICGSRADLRGFAYIHDNVNVGFDIDLCRAVGAAILDGKWDSIIVKLLPTDMRKQAVKSASVDILSRNTTWTSSRDSEWGNFVNIMFHDGQGFMVRTDSHIELLTDLSGKSICVTEGTTSEENLRITFRKTNMNYTPILASESSIAKDKFLAGECDAFTTDKSSLIGYRKQIIDPSPYKILDVTISREPLGPVVPHGDDEWFDIVKTIMFGLIEAERLGIKQKDVHDILNGNHELSTNPEVMLLLGMSESDFGQASLRLSQDAIARAVAAVGNYGEIYDRYFEDVERGYNDLWEKGGLIYAPPIR